MKALFNFRLGSVPHATSKGHRGGELNAYLVYTLRLTVANRQKSQCFISP